MSDTHGRFILTPQLISHVRNASTTGAALAMVLSLSVCITAAWIYSVPSARHHLDRVSFRLLLWSMGVEVLYTACFLVLTRDAELTQNGTACGAFVYLLLATMGVCNWLCTCIGLNLMLAITFGVNTIQSRLERWYILGSFILGFGVPLVPAILGHFGLDPWYTVCYFTQGDKSERIRDFILDLYLWQLLSCLIAAFCVTTVVITLLRRSRATERILFRGNTLAVTSAELRQITSSTAPLETSTPTRKRTWYHRLLRRDPGAKVSHMHRLQDKLATIAFKISLYPIALLLINVVITAEDLAYTSRGGLFNMGQYAVYWLHNFLYGGRGIFFALLGVFVDPCLRLGVPAAWRARRDGRRHHKSTANEVNGTWDDSQSITNFLSTTGPDYEEYTSSPRLDGQAGTPHSGGRGSVARWFGLSSPDVEAGERREVDVEMMGSEKGMMESEKGDADIESGELRTSLLLGRREGDASTQELSVIIDAPPVRFSPTSTAQPPAPRSTPRDADWIQPLATAILTRAPSGGQQLARSNSDPAMGAAARRRRELQKAAEELYAQAQARL